MCRAPRSAKMSAWALALQLAQEDASHTVTIDDDNLRKVRAELLSTSTAFIDSCHEKLTAITRSSPHPGLTGAAMYVLCLRPRASIFAFSAYVLAYLVDLGPFAWCVSASGHPQSHPCLRTPTRGGRATTCLGPPGEKISTVPYLSM